MPLSDAAIRGHVTMVILQRMDQDAARRTEALTEYLTITMPNMDTSTATSLSSLVPTILPDLYAKWITMFVERLLETVPKNQLELLCDGNEENAATLILIYIMFLESERMEKQIEDDLKSYGLEHSGDQDTGGIVADYLRAKVAQLKESVRGGKNGEGNSMQ
ncbi:MAG: hypothetical protein PHO79_04930 [Desulfoplanes sp.]|nr:hypothetical protein [Desulfoplanes sp.]